MHAIEKLLAEKAGKEQVVTGEIVNCDVDIAGINDLYLQTVRSFYEMGGEQVFDADKIVMFFDHYAPCATITQAENHKQFREFCTEQGIEKLMDIDQGVCHQVLADKGLVHPGEIVVVTDSHTTTHGAFGAFGTGVGATDLATIMITGKLWFMVPEIFKIDLVVNCSQEFLLRISFCISLATWEQITVFIRRWNLLGLWYRNLAFRKECACAICRQRWAAKPATSSRTL